MKEASTPQKRINLHYKEYLGYLYVNILPRLYYCRLASTDSPGMSRVSRESVDTLSRGYYIGWHPRIIRGCPEYPGIRGYSAKEVLYRLASTDSPGMSRVSRESMDTLSRGYYIGWHPRIVRGCPEYPGNPWILCQGGII